MQSFIPQHHLDKAFVDFCLPQLQILQPKLAICCGRQVMQSALNYYNLRDQKLIAVGTHFKGGNITYCYQRHPGATATNTNGGISVAISNWQNTKRLLDLYKES
jgi:uracil-DNA glycosylase